MNPTFKVIHSIPGRIRICIPLLANLQEHSVIEELLSSIEGIEKVKIEAITQSMLIYYDASRLRVKDVLHFVSLICLFIQQVSEEENKVHPNERHSIVEKLVDLWAYAVFSVEKEAKKHLNIPDYVNSITEFLSVLTKK